MARRVKIRGEVVLKDVEVRWSCPRCKNSNTSVMGKHLYDLKPGDLVEKGDTCRTCGLLATFGLVDWAGKNAGKEKTLFKLSILSENFAGYLAPGGKGTVEVSLAGIPFEGDEVDRIYDRARDIMEIIRAAMIRQIKEREDDALHDAKPPLIHPGVMEKLMKQESGDDK